MNTKVSSVSSSHHIGIIGAGAMGAGIAQVAASGGDQVSLYDISEEALERGLANIHTGLSKLVELGKIDGNDRNTVAARIRSTQKLEDLSTCEFIIEAIIEDLDTKLTLFNKLETLVSNRSILATNTSSISITTLGSRLENPERFVGMHFFNPAPVMKLVEVIRGSATTQEAINSVHKLAKRWGKIPVIAKSTPGFIVNRVARAYYAEPLKLFEENAASVEVVDLMFKRSAGFRMGPFELMDLIGHDVNYAVTESIYNAYYQHPRFLPSIAQKDLVDGNRLGQKTGRGFYRYPLTESSNNLAVSSEYRPAKCMVLGELGAASPLIQRASDSGLSIRTDSGTGFIEVDGVRLVLTDGRTATQLAAETAYDHTVVFDLALNYREVSLLCLAKADQADEKSIEIAAGFFNRLGIDVMQIDDTPGLCVMRTICMLANEASRLIEEQICDVTSVDQAVRFGLNYPKGMLEWADSIGIGRVLDVLNNMQRHYGSERYAASILIQRKAACGKPFHAGPSYE